MGKSRIHPSRRSGPEAPVRLTAGKTSAATNRNTGKLRNTKAVVSAIMDSWRIFMEAWTEASRGLPHRKARANAQGPKFGPELLFRRSVTDENRRAQNLHRRQPAARLWRPLFP